MSTALGVKQMEQTSETSNKKIAKINRRSTENPPHKEFLLFEHEGFCSSLIPFASLTITISSSR